MDLLNYFADILEIFYKLLAMFWVVNILQLIQLSFTFSIPHMVSLGFLTIPTIICLTQSNGLYDGWYGQPPKLPNWMKVEVVLEHLTFCSLSVLRQYSLVCPFRRQHLPLIRYLGASVMQCLGNLDIDWSCISFVISLKSWENKTTW